MCAAACCRLGLSNPAACAHEPAELRDHGFTTKAAQFHTRSSAVYEYLPVCYIQVLKVSQAFVVYVLLTCTGEETVAEAAA